MTDSLPWTTMDGYQQEAMTFIMNSAPSSLLYSAVELAGEAGEVCEKVKKIIRDDVGQVGPKAREALSKELGDVLWVVARLAHHLHLPLSQIATENLSKLHDRRGRNVLSGSGDSR